MSRNRNGCPFRMAYDVAFHEKAGWSQAGSWPVPILRQGFSPPS